MALTMLMLPCILFSLAGAMAPEYFPPAAPSALAKLRDIGKSIRANDNNSVLGDLIKGSRADLEQVPAKTRNHIGLGPAVVVGRSCCAQRSRI